MKKLRVACYGYLLVSLVSCAAAFVYWFHPNLDPIATCWFIGCFLVGYGIIRIVGFFQKIPIVWPFTLTLPAGC